jgi:hypothetical protein
MPKQNFAPQAQTEFVAEASESRSLKGNENPCTADVVHGSVGEEGKEGKPVGVTYI